MPTSSHLLCGCGRFMRPVKNGVTVEELTEDGRSYKLWDADRWACPACGAVVVTGFGKHPIAEHYQDTYAAQRDRLQPIIAGRCAEPETV